MQSRLVNYLETCVQFISTLLPAQEVSKLVIVVMKSHSYCSLSDLNLFAVYEIPQWIPFSRFQVSGSTLPLFQGNTKKERNVENIYCESSKKILGGCLKEIKFHYWVFCSHRPWRISYSL